MELENEPNEGLKINEETMNALNKKVVELESEKEVVETSRK